MDNVYDYFEILNKEYLDLKRSKEYRIGEAICRYWDNIMHFRIKKIARELSDHRATRIIKKRYISYNSLEVTQKEKTDTKSRIAVYTCITGGYDSIQKPLPIFENVDYFLLCDKKNEYGDCYKGFKVLEIPKEIIEKGSILANRYVKLHPALFFDSYDYAIYIDGNVRVVGDIRTFVTRCNKKTGIAMHLHRERNCIYQEAEVCKLLHRGNKKKIDEQIGKYMRNGFPRHFGMHEATIIASDLKNDLSILLLERWWDEYVSTGSLRDQLSWPYIIWNSGYTIQDVGCLGCDIFQNYKIQIVKHR